MSAHKRIGQIIELFWHRETFHSTIMKFPLCSFWNTSAFVRALCFHKLLTQQSRLKELINFSYLWEGEDLLGAKLSHQDFRKVCHKFKMHNKKESFSAASTSIIKKILKKYWVKHRLWLLNVRGVRIVSHWWILGSCVLFSGLVFFLLSLTPGSG